MKHLGNTRGNKRGGGVIAEEAVPNVQVIGAAQDNPTLQRYVAIDL